MSNNRNSGAITNNDILWDAIIKKGFEITLCVRYGYSSSDGHVRRRVLLLKRHGVDGLLDVGWCVGRMMSLSGSRTQQTIG
ncbi:hypothetical protein HanIR_Chr12g0593761 [Helianthus annuus]|nr:hypothetical protein HanIR_Chr12g0593761 [Helianthus annuus]KAJ0505956.1 hypothetical protein HanHA89_Chr12g0476401 [Helianthus annuus]KAJ0675627.1 hypothetical protein HanLR1_Chr12g0453301 [Helianthus annuus]